MDPIQQYILGLGSNVGGPRTTIEVALTLLGMEFEILRISPFYQSAPLGPSERCYLNAALSIQSPLSPRDVLQRTQSIELALGRKREIRWAARTLDIDILWWEGGEFENDTLRIPHPALYERDFALIPARDVQNDALPLGNERGRTLSRWPAGGQAPAAIAQLCETLEHRRQRARQASPVSFAAFDVHVRQLESFDDAGLLPNPAADYIGDVICHDRFPLEIRTIRGIH